MKPNRIFLIDDHTLMRAGIRSLLTNSMDMKVVGEADTGRKALAGIRTHQPDVVLMDLAMPEMNGWETTARVTKEFPKIRVLILSMHANEEYVIKALRAGAAGYLLKDALPDELELAIRAVVKGQMYLSPAISSVVVNEVRKPQPHEVNSLEHLTPRQRETLQLIAEGNSTKQIAQILGLSVKTIEMHRTHLMQRLKIHNTANLVRCAIQLQLIIPDW
jgi:DNA-binding NarL/FixJ family response regulator